MEQISLIGQIGLIGVFGLMIGSFLNVLIWRLNDEKAPKFWQGRSICPKCKHKLSWKDNIPLLSFILLRGKCRYCRKKISWQYPVVELTTGAAFVLAWVLSPAQLDLLVKLDILVIVAVFIVIFFSDLIYGFIPDEMVVAGSLLSILYLILNTQYGILPNFLTGIVTSLAFLAVVVATKFRGMGLGDVKLAFFMGLLLGWPKVGVALWMAFAIGGLFAIILLILKRTRLSATIPLGPFLVLGVLIAAVWSNQILQGIGL